MALVSKKILCNTVSPLLQFNRFRGKINIRRPRAPHFEKALYQVLTKPWFINPNKDKTPFELCPGPVFKRKEVGDNPLQQIIAKELYTWIETSKLVAFFHQNPMKSEEAFQAFLKLRKENMHFKKFGKRTLEMAVKDTPYEVLLDFYVSQNMIVFSPELEIKKMLNVTKKFPQLVLLAGILNGKFVSKEDVIKYSMIPNIQTAQSGLVQTLNSVGSQIVSKLNSHQIQFVSNLVERKKQLSGND